jgi:hypothetical protein
VLSIQKGTQLEKNSTIELRNLEISEIKRVRTYWVDYWRSGCYEEREENSEEITLCLWRWTQIQ